MAKSQILKMSNLLRTMSRRQGVKNVIDASPETLTEIYEHFLREISPNLQKSARRLLHLMIGSSRPLKLAEMRLLEAIKGHHHNIDEVEDAAQLDIQQTLDAVLGPLTRIRNSRIYFVHQSLEEFLVALSSDSANPLSVLYGIDPRKASLKLAKACVRYLLLDDFKHDLFSPGQAKITDSPSSSLEDSPTISSTEELNEMTLEELWSGFNLGENSVFKDFTESEAEVCTSLSTAYTLFDYSALHWAKHFAAADSIASPRLHNSVIRLSDSTSIPGSNWSRYYWLHVETSLLRPQDFLPTLTASYFGHFTSLKMLLRHGPIVSDIGESAVYWASRMGHAGLVDLLLRARISPGVKVIHGQSALTAAVQFDHLDAVKLLLRDEGFTSDVHGYRVNHAPIGGRTPLSIAAGNGNIKIVRQLLQHDRIEPDLPDFNQWTPLFWAAGGKHIDVVQVLIADPSTDVNHLDRSGRNILSWAASVGELELVRHLESVKYLNADEPDREGRTPFSRAASGGHLGTLDFFRRSNRVDISRKDNNGRNAISWACSAGHHKVVEYLVKLDQKDADEADLDGWTPLAWALFNRNPQTVQALLDSGVVDANKKDFSGRSPLAWAASYGYLDVVQILLNTAGIDVDSKDHNGGTPLLAASRFPEIAELLKDFRKENLMTRT